MDEMVPAFVRPDLNDGKSARDDRASSALAEKRQKATKTRGLKKPDLDEKIVFMGRVG